MWDRYSRDVRGLRVRSIGIGMGAAVLEGCFRKIDCVGFGGSGVEVDGPASGGIGSASAATGGDASDFRSDI